MDKPTFGEVKSIIKRIKVVDRQLEWVEKPTNSTFLYCQAQVLDESNETVEGVSFEGQFKRPSDLIIERYAFTIFLLRNSIKYRIFQLEVDDWEKLTHRDRNAGEFIYGPHFHIGCRHHWPESEVIPASQARKDYDFAAWLIDYCKRANLKLEHPLEHPATQGELSFGLL